MLMLTSLVHVTACTVFMVTIVWQGIYSPVPVDLGEYGEDPDSAIGPWQLPDWLPLERPLNALVNLGYVLISAAWIVRTYLAERVGLVGALHAYLAYAFAWMGVLYGPIQLARVVWQTQGTAVLDQWVTLPFFAWVVLWCRSLEAGWDDRSALLLLLSSLLSYNLVFFGDYGFEVALLLHVARAFGAALSANTRHPRPGSGALVAGAFAALAAFIGLKLLDLHLPLYSRLFAEVSGHFLSKLLGDIALMHLAFVFFERIEIGLQVERLAESKGLWTKKKK